MLGCRNTSSSHRFPNTTALRKTGFWDEQSRHHRRFTTLGLGIERIMAFRFSICEREVLVVLFNDFAFTGLFGRISPSIASSNAGMLLFQAGRE